MHSKALPSSLGRIRDPARFTPRVLKLPEVHHGEGRVSEAPPGGHEVALHGVGDHLVPLHLQGAQGQHAPATSGHILQKLVHPGEGITCRLGTLPDRISWAIYHAQSWGMMAVISMQYHLFVTSCHPHAALRSCECKGRERKGRKYRAISAFLVNSEPAAERKGEEGGKNRTSCLHRSPAERCGRALPQPQEEAVPWRCPHSETHPSWSQGTMLMGLHGGAWQLSLMLRVHMDFNGCLHLPFLYRAGHPLSTSQKAVIQERDSLGSVFGRHGIYMFWATFVWQWPTNTFQMQPKIPGRPVHLGSCCQTPWFANTCYAEQQDRLLHFFHLRPTLGLLCASHASMAWASGKTATWFFRFKCCTS